MGVIRNSYKNSIKFQKVMLKEIGDANLKSRLGNKSAFLCAVLIYSANKNDQYLIKIKL